MLLPCPVDIHGLADCHGLPVANHWHLTLLAVAHAVGGGDDAVGDHIDPLRHLHGEGHLCGILHLHLFGMMADGVARSGIGEQQAHLHLSGHLPLLTGHYFRHQRQRVAAAQEARHIGLHHERLGGDEGAVEGAYLEVAGDGQTFDIPACEQFGHREAVGYRAVGAGAQLGSEESQRVEVGAHLGLLARRGAAGSSPLDNLYGFKRAGFICHRSNCHIETFLFHFHFVCNNRKFNHRLVGNTCRLVHAHAAPTAIVRQCILEGPHRGIATLIVEAPIFVQPTACAASDMQRTDAGGEVRPPRREAPLSRAAIRVQCIVVHCHHQRTLNS